MVKIGDNISFKDGNVTSTGKVYLEEKYYYGVIKKSGEQVGVPKLAVIATLDSNMQHSAYTPQHVQQVSDSAGGEAIGCWVIMLLVLGLGLYFIVTALPNG